MPNEVSIRLKEAGAEVGPIDSACSIFISAEDIDRVLEITNEWCKNDPLLGLLVQTRVHIATWLPVRSGDLSSLEHDCLTPNGGLVIARTGFNLHKTTSTIRVVPITDEQHSILSSLSSAIRRFTGTEGDLLMRDSGAAEGVGRDNDAQEMLNQALKLVTGEHRARPHSIRAATLQKIAWPDWPIAAKQLLNSSLSISDARALTTSWQLAPTRFSKAAAAAGHADIRAALGNYVSAWPLVHAIWARSQLAGLTPGVNLQKTLGLAPTALRQARSRASRTYDQSSIQENGFSSWEWIESRLNSEQQKNQLVPQLQRQDQAIDVEPKTQQPVIYDTTSERKVLYLSLRCLGLTMERSVNKSELPWSIAQDLERFLPEEKIIDAASQRSKSSTPPRGLAADINMCLSPEGTALRNWILGLSGPQLMVAYAAFLRESPATAAQWNQSTDWRGVAERMPEGMKLIVQRGVSYVTPSEITQSLHAGSRYELKPDPRLGSRPKVSVWPTDNNRVASARLTSIARFTVMTTKALKGS